MTPIEPGEEDTCPRERRPVSAETVVLGLAVSLALVLRWAALDRESLWFDEGFSWWLSSLEPARLVRQFSRDVQTPGYFLVLHYWTMLFGDSALAMRSLSATLSTLCIAATWLLARDLVGRGWGTVLGTSLFALSSLQILHAREARYYPLLTLLVLLSWIGLLRWTRTRQARWLALLALAAAGSLYTHNMMLLYLPALAAAWLLLDRDRPTPRRIFDVALTLLAVVVAWLPWMPTFLQQLQWTRGRFWAAPPGLTDLLETLASLAGTDAYRLNSLGWAASARLGLEPPLRTAESWGLFVVGLLTIASVVLLFRRETRRTALVLLCLLLIPVLTSFVRSVVSQPVFLTRTFIPGTAAACLLLALSARVDARVPRRLAAIAAGTILVLSGWSAVSLVAGQRQEDWRGAYAVLRDLPREATLLVFVANEGEAVFRYYESREPGLPRFERIGLPSGYFDTDPPEPVRRVLGDEDLSLLRRMLDENRHRRVVLISAHEHFSDPDRLTERYLDQRLRPLRRIRLHNVSVMEYAAD